MKQKIIQKIIHGQNVFFKDIPENEFKQFWNEVEQNKEIIINEEFTGVKLKTY